MWSSSPNVGSYKFGFGFDFGVGYTFFFNPHWGISTGASAAFFNSKYALPTFGEEYRTSDGVDGIADNFKYNYTATGYTEKQRATFLTIPLMLHFEVGKFYAELGGKAGFPLGSITYNGRLDKLQASGKIDGYGSPIEAPKFMGFGTFQGLSNTGSLTQSKPVFFASAEAGRKWKLTQNWSLYTGAYIDYGLNKIDVAIENAKVNEKDKFIDYNAHYPDKDANYQPAGSFFAKTANDNKSFVDKMVLSPMSVGIRITLAFGKIHRKPNPDTPPPATTPPPPPEDTPPPIIAAAPIDTATTKQGWSEEKIEDVKRLQQPINFELNKSDLRDESRAAVDAEVLYLKRRLDEKARILKKYPELQVRIEGHTCDIGTDERNMELGNERAEIVAEYMLEKGIPATVVTEIVGKSSTEPLFPNTNEENRRRNRRAVIVVVDE
ncbi:hypothetical protein AGMMS49965_08420 [Bacteroidia bacterium]|nr:hypothetical protein AGMMS49965_08420 [Bacteroidia bacterium]